MLAEMVPAIDGGPSPCLARMKTPFDFNNNRGLLTFNLRRETKPATELAKEPVPRHFCVSNVYPVWAARLMWSPDAWPLWKDEEVGENEVGLLYPSMII